MPFQQITDQVGVGEADSGQWRSVKEIPLRILVGLSGAGKTTLCKSLLAGRSCRLLPDRRSLTDQLILPLVQDWDGKKGKIWDRGQRFDATRRFREHCPGGMGFLLSELRVRSDALDAQWIFDGLRGLEEVQAAAARLPAATFIVLSAPDAVRLQRLLFRKDRFDAVQEAPLDWEADHWREAFRPDEQQTLLHFLERNRIGKDEFFKKYRIVVKERENYDHNSARLFLQQSLPEKTLCIDTSCVSEQDVFEHVCRGLAWID